MSFFAYQYIENMLIVCGGPKRKSLFNSEAVFDSSLVDTVAGQMIDYASALGACRSKIALQIISNMFKDKDWDSNDSPKILDFINKREEWKTENILAPHEIIKLPSFVEHFGKTISVSDLKKMQSNLEQEFLFALLWGLANPDKFKLWFEKKFTEDKKILEVAQKAGLNVDSIPTLEQYLLNCDEMIKDYEQKMGNLPITIPVKLMKDAQQLGCIIN